VCEGLVLYPASATFSIAANLDFTEARDSEWQWHPLGIRCTSLQSDNHASSYRSVFTGRMPFLPPNQQRQSTEGRYN